MGSLEGSFPETAWFAAKGWSRRVRFASLLLILVSATAISPAQAADSLPQRFARLSCAVVHIQATGSSGTGFFIDAQGDILTAAHVILDRSYTPEGTGFSETIGIKAGAQFIGSTGATTMFPPQHLKQSDLQNATHDLAIVSSGHASSCFLRLGDPNSLIVGDHLIAIGFPGSSSTGVLYEGFLSARQSEIHVLGPVTGQPGVVVQSSYNVLRVQMPITPGASGSPLISDDDKVVGVVAEIPVATLSDIENIIQAYISSPQGSGIILGGFDTNKILAEVAYVVTEFESPGSGLAVPISYLSH